jgi:hypothetical protein
MEQLGLYKYLPNVENFLTANILPSAHSNWSIVDSLLTTLFLNTPQRKESFSESLHLTIVFKKLQNYFFRCLIFLFPKSRSTCS